MLLGLFLLGADQQEIEHHKNQHERQKAHDIKTRTASGGLGVSWRNQHLGPSNARGRNRPGGTGHMGFDGREKKRPDHSRWGPNCNATGGGGPGPADWPFQGRARRGRTTP